EALGRGEVRAHGDGLAARGLDLCDDLVRPGRLLAAVDDDVRALGGEQLRGGRTDPARGSGDDGGLACKGAHGELLRDRGSVSVKGGARCAGRDRSGRAPPTVRAYRSPSTRRFGRTATRPLGWPGARVAELADALDLGSSARGREGSSPFSRTHAAAAEAAAAQTT